MHDLTPRILSVPAELAGLRLDVALVRLLPSVSRARVQELIADGGVKVGGVTAERAAHTLAAGDTLEIVEVVRSRERPGGTAAAELSIVFEDEHLAVIDKPPGMVVHPGPGHRGDSLIERLGFAAKAAGWPDPSRAGVVHRLDRDTSGVLVLAKTPAALAGL